jgi:hypothetical protein
VPTIPLQQSCFDRAPPPRSAPGLASDADPLRPAALPKSPAPPIRYSDSLEAVPADEGRIHEDLIHTFARIQDATLKHCGQAARGLHARSHGLLNGRLEVLPGLPPHLAQGAFARAGTHDVVMRLSTSPGDALDESVSAPRGLALKILDVGGERLPGSEGTTQDFVLASAPSFTAPDTRAFLSRLRVVALTADTPQVFKEALSALMREVEALQEALGVKRPSANTARGAHEERHILDETYYTQAPLRWGDYVGKVSMAPVSPELMALARARSKFAGGPSDRRDTVSAFFAEHGGTWELRVQLMTDRETMPIEDASVVWPESESPYVAVARVSAPPQESWSDAKVRAIDDGMAFSPWQGLAAHRPLGSIMRARRVAYPRSAAFRGERNGCPVREPRAAFEVIR